jgi:hypothetical protein
MVASVAALLLLTAVVVRGVVAGSSCCWGLSKGLRVCALDALVLGSCWLAVAMAMGRYAGDHLLVPVLLDVAG